MERPVTSHVASVAVRPEWVAFRPRAVFAVCSCALMINGVWHARGACNVCHGAGHRSLALEVRGG
jgi:hypothetical protein